MCVYVCAGSWTRNPICPQWENFAMENPHSPIIHSEAFFVEPLLSTYRAIMSAKSNARDASRGFSVLVVHLIISVMLRGKGFVLEGHIGLERYQDVIPPMHVEDATATLTAPTRGRGIIRGQLFPSRRSAVDSPKAGCVEISASRATAMTTQADRANAHATA